MEEQLQAVFDEYYIKEEPKWETNYGFSGTSIHAAHDMTELIRHSARKTGLMALDRIPPAMYKGPYLLDDVVYAPYYVELHHINSSDREIKRLAQTKSEMNKYMLLLEVCYMRHLSTYLDESVWTEMKKKYLGDLEAAHDKMKSISGIPMEHEKQLRSIFEKYTIKEKPVWDISRGPFMTSYNISSSGTEVLLEPLDSLSSIYKGPYIIDRIAYAKDFYRDLTKITYWFKLNMIYANSLEGYHRYLLLLESQYLMHLNTVYDHHIWEETRQKYNRQIDKAYREMYTIVHGEEAADEFFVEEPPYVEDVVYYGGVGASIFMIMTLTGLVMSAEYLLT